MIFVTENFKGNKNLQGWQKSDENTAPFPFIALAKVETF